MSYPGYTTEEVCERGEALYQHQIRAQIEGANKGKFLVLDIKTGEYEIDANHLAAAERLLARKPDGVLYSVRIGFPAAYRLGGKFRVQPT